MKCHFRKAFFAFPTKPAELFDTISAAMSAPEDAWDKISIRPWPQVDIFGAALGDEIRREIAAADLLVCDITFANCNVYYEIGYALGVGKPIAPVANTSFVDVKRKIQEDGIFDGIGYKSYDNSGQLANILNHLPEHTLIDLYSKPINFQQPLYIIDTLRKTDFRNAIVSAIKASKIFYRSFDPVEVARFSTIPILVDATSSAGVIVPLLAPHTDDSERHNLRAALLSGIGHGLRRPTLLIQREFSFVPADYKDLVVSISNEKDIETRVVAFAKDAVIDAQSIPTTPRSRLKSNALQTLSLGSSAAENEFRTLELYFVETAEYLRTIRGEARIVAGRKGSGKTAIFFRVRDNFRTLHEFIVTDLKPESHQLSLFRQELLKASDVGLFDHTLSAFWYFVLLSEILLTIRQQYEYRSKRDSNALQDVMAINKALEQFAIYEKGDFTSRINRLGGIIVEELKALKARNLTLTPERLTNVVFRDGITKIRELIDLYTANTSTVVLLFDNIDKGWQSQGVDQFDVRTRKITDRDS